MSSSPTTPSGFGALRWSCAAPAGVSSVTCSVHGKVLPPIVDAQRASRRASTRAAALWRCGRCASPGRTAFSVRVIAGRQVPSRSVRVARHEQRAARRVRRHRPIVERAQLAGDVAGADSASPRSARARRPRDARPGRRARARRSRATARRPRRPAQVEATPPGRASMSPSLQRSASPSRSSWPRPRSTAQISPLAAKRAGEPLAAADAGVARQHERRGRGMVGAERRRQVERHEAGRHVAGEGARCLSATKACGSSAGRAMLKPCSTGT